jgi:hypothetical protein
MLAPNDIAIDIHRWTTSSKETSFSSRFSLLIEFSTFRKNSTSWSVKVSVICMIAPPVDHYNITYYNASYYTWDRGKGIAHLLIAILCYATPMEVTRRTFYWEKYFQNNNLLPSNYQTV